jgi:hypothetical protein
MSSYTLKAKRQNPVLTNRIVIINKLNGICVHSNVTTKENTIHLIILDAAGIGGRKKRLPGEV